MYFSSLNPKRVVKPTAKRHLPMCVLTRRHNMFSCITGPKPRSLCSCCSAGSAVLRQICSTDYWNSSSNRMCRDALTSFIRSTRTSTTTRTTRSTFHYQNVVCGPRSSERELRDACPEINSTRRGFATGNCFESARLIGFATKPSSFKIKSVCAILFLGTRGNTQTTASF